MTRLILSLWLACVGGFAHADESYTCADVRAAIRTVARGAGVNEKRAAEILEATARSAGATNEQIARAKACLSR